MTVIKQTGTTRAERYLARICEETFLSLWSFPNVFRNEFIPGTRTGKEVCDLLVVCGDHVIIFADKDCAVPSTGKVGLDWSRWFRRAVEANARQLHGAERWLRQFPDRLFLDPSCTQALPLDWAPGAATRFHLVVVAHNIAARCAAFHGGSGSLMIRSDVRGLSAHTEPFVVGDLDPERSFVHVFDDTTLPVLLGELDTITDFVTYLDRKVAFLRGSTLCSAAGEEELLSWYLRRTGADGTHDFVLPESDARGVVLLEGQYLAYLENPQTMAKRKADEVSYAWDRLIQKFAYYGMRGEQYFATQGGVKDTERILRFMAREPRVRRRMLARKLVECVTTTAPDERRTSMLLPARPDDPYYLFTMLPWADEHSEEENRAMRMWFLTHSCMVVRLMHPEARCAVGIATESGNQKPGRTEDAIYYDFGKWSVADEQEAREFQEKTGVLTRARMTRGTEHEYPVVDVPPLPGSQRNRPCPCGSGLKYKKCHGRPRTS